MDGRSRLDLVRSVHAYLCAFYLFLFSFWVRIRWTSQDLYGYDGIACRQKCRKNLMYCWARQKGDDGQPGRGMYGGAKYVGLS